MPKGKALFHPIRLALTGEAEGLELDLCPLIERGAAVTGRDTSVRTIAPVAERAAAFLRELESTDRTA